MVGKRVLIDRGLYDEKNFAWMRHQQKMVYIAPGKGGTDISEFIHALSDTNYHGKRMPDRGGYQPKTEWGKRKKMVQDAKINRKDETVKKEPLEGEKEVIHFWITNHKTACDALLSRRYCPVHGKKQKARFNELRECMQESIEEIMENVRIGNDRLPVQSRMVAIAGKRMSTAATITLDYTPRGGRHPKSMEPSVVHDIPPFLL